MKVDNKYSVPDPGLAGSLYTGELCFLVIVCSQLLAALVPCLGPALPSLPAPLPVLAVNTVLLPACLLLPAVWDRCGPARAAARAEKARRERRLRAVSAHKRRLGRTRQVFRSAAWPDL